jgi:hypothetical protein
MTPKLCQDNRKATQFENGLYSISQFVSFPSYFFDPYLRFAGKSYDADKLPI